MNRRAKFDAASFILSGEICNRTKNTQTVIYPHVAYRHVWIQTAAARISKLDREMFHHESSFSRHENSADVGFLVVWPYF